jgi:N6-adenosine-specific RNA methylase IME4
MSSRHLPTPPHAGSYGVIYADPPWNFKTWSDKGKGRSAEAHFDCMELGGIEALPVRSWAAKKAVLYLWTTVPHLAQALAVIPAWGFTYKSNFVWAKRVRGFGTGYWCRNQHELLLIGARGSKVCPRFRGIEAQGSVIDGQLREYARKPDRAREIIELYHPGVPKLEMFPRETLPGWDAWGDQVGLFDRGAVKTRRWASNSWPGRP